MIEKPNCLDDRSSSRWILQLDESSRVDSLPQKLHQVESREARPAAFEPRSTSPHVTSWCASPFRCWCCCRRAACPTSNSRRARGPAIPVRRVPDRRTAPRPAPEPGRSAGTVRPVRGDVGSHWAVGRPSNGPTPGVDGVAGQVGIRTEPQVRY